MLLSLLNPSRPCSCEFQCTNPASSSVFKRCPGRHSCWCCSGISSVCCAGWRVPQPHCTWQEICCSSLGPLFYPFLLWEFHPVLKTCARHSAASWGHPTNTLTGYLELILCFAWARKVYFDLFCRMNSSQVKKINK